MKKLYYGGTILTMEEDVKQAEAVVVEDDGIAYAGPMSEALYQEADQVIDLQGKCLMPAFIDPHSHFFSAVGGFLQVSLAEVSSLEELGARITAYIRQNPPTPGAWVQAVGYDQTILPGQKHPTRSFLDEICPEHPLVVQHISGHMGVLNSAALKQLGYDNETVLEPGNNLAEGFLQESAFVSCLRRIPSPDAAALLAACEKAQQMYASYGITTVQEGMMVKEMIPLYQMLLATGKLKLDIIAYADIKDEKQIYDTFGENEKGHFKIGGYKIFLDGSPQGGTAWMREPYEGTDNYGAATMTDAAVLEAVQKAAKNKRQLLAHCNGDAACGQFLSALETVAREDPEFPKTRPVFIHAQLIGLDQLPAVKKTGAVISFFVSHVFHWGDIHIRNFGMERAAGISPANTALSLGIPITFHTDTPVIAPDLLEAVGCAVNRTTKNGVVLGPQQSISVEEALKAITINSAYQYFAENEIGSIRAGKKADLVILDRNPLEVQPEEISSIRVLETIKSGEPIFSRS